MPIFKNIPTAIVASLGIYFAFMLHIYIPNMGGHGLKLPANLVCWAVIAWVIILGSLFAFHSHKFCHSSSLIWFIAGGILLSLPLLLADSVNAVATVPRIAGLWGGIALYWALLQIPLNLRVKRILLLVLLFSTLTEASLALWQSTTSLTDNWMEFVPGSRPYGIFQQINVLASFLATGYAIALLLFATTKNTLVCYFSAFAIITLIAVLTLLQSRIGCLTAGVVVCIFAIQYFKHSPRGKWLVIFSILGLGIGLLLLHYQILTGEQAYIDKEGSTAARMLITLYTLEMILQHPLSGWGYGSFAYEFARFAHEQGLMTNNNLISLFDVEHAHNEFLFGWVEGGIIAAVGMVAIALGYLTPLKKSFTATSDRFLFSIWVVSLPIALHLMTEYPLYQSSAHWLVLILLCRLCLAERNISIKCGGRISLMLAVFFACATLLFMVTGLQTSKVLTEFERSGMRDFTSAELLINPYAQWERFQYDKHISLLLQFNRTHDETLLDEFTRWGMDYIKIHNDKNVYSSLEMIARHQKNEERVSQLQEQKNSIF